MELPAEQYEGPYLRPGNRVYVKALWFHACDTCGAPCCGTGDWDSGANWNHESCPHTNHPCVERCPGVMAPSFKRFNEKGRREL
jgi:hypothetical protein